MSTPQAGDLGDAVFDPNAQDDVPPDTEGPTPLVAVGELVMGVALSLPRRGASPVQHRIAAANEQARLLALSRLERFLPGYDFAAAAQNTDDRRFSVLEIGTELLEHLDAVRVIERLIGEKEHAFAPGGVTFSHGDSKGHQLPPPMAARGMNSASNPYGRLEVGGLAANLATQWTTILNGIDRFDPRIAAVASDVSAVYGARVNTNVYLSFADATGFGPHWDTHDTIIVQVHGEKRWALYNPTVLSAQAPWSDRGVSGSEIWRGVLRPGMALMIPRGWGHEVLGSDDLSIHYTIGINRVEVHHLLERVAYEAGMQPLLRADVPFDLRAPILSYAGTPLEDPNGLGREIGDLITPELIDRGVASYRARLELRRHSQLTATFAPLALDRWDGTVIRIPTVGAVMMLDESADAVTLGFDNRSVQIRAEALDAFVALADSEPRALDALPPVLVDGEDQRARFVRELVANNIAVLETRT